MNRPGRRALPVRGTVFYTTASSPFISQVISNAGANQPIVSDSILAIRGMNLGSSNLYIKIGDAKIKPQLLQSQEIKIDLCSLSNDERSALRAGVQSLQLLQQVPKQAKYEPQQVVGSNVVPFVLCPKVKVTQGTNIEELRPMF